LLLQAIINLQEISIAIKTDALRSQEIKGKTGNIAQDPVDNNKPEYHPNEIFGINKLQCKQLLSSQDK
jgi:hypothetical protein